MKRATRPTLRESMIILWAKAQFEVATDGVLKATPAAFAGYLLITWGAAPVAMQHVPRGVSPYWVQVTEYLQRVDTEEPK